MLLPPPDAADQLFSMAQQIKNQTAQAVQKFAVLATPENLALADTRHPGASAAIIAMVTSMKATAGVT